VGGRGACSRAALAGGRCSSLCKGCDNLRRSDGGTHDTHNVPPHSGAAAVHSAGGQPWRQPSCGSHGRAAAFHLGCASQQARSSGGQAEPCSPSGPPALHGCVRRWRLGLHWCACAVLIYIMICCRISLLLFGSSAALASSGRNSCCSCLASLSLAGAAGDERSVLVWEPRKWTPLDRWSNCLKYELTSLHFSSGECIAVLHCGAAPAHTAPASHSK
jgi:hypothetical protein